MARSFLYKIYSGREFPVTTLQILLLMSIRILYICPVQLNGRVGINGIVGGGDKNGKKYTRTIEFHGRVEKGRLRNALGDFVALKFYLRAVLFETYFVVV